MMLQSILKEIQDTVIKYAEIIAKVTKVDVEIVDTWKTWGQKTWGQG